MNKKKWNIIIMVILVIATIWVIFSKLSIHEFVSVIKNSNIYYLITGIICMLLFWGLEALMLDILIKKVSPKSTFWTSLKTTLIGQYYSLLTPFASGGQPAQLYIMTKDDISISNGTAVLVGKFLIFQVTVTIYALLLSILRIRLLFNNFDTVSAFAIMGLTINMIGLSVIILMAFKPNLLEKMICKIVNLLSKIKIIKNSECVAKKTHNFIEEYRHSITVLKNDKKMAATLFIITIVQLTIYFSITFFIYKALGLKHSSLIDIIAMQALLYMAVAFVPIPGTVGASETGFILLFGSIFTGHFATVAMLLWRGISYYFGLIFCGMFSLAVYLNDKYKIIKYKLV